MLAPLPSDVVGLYITVRSTRLYAINRTALSTSIGLAVVGGGKHYFLALAFHISYVSPTLCALSKAILHEILGITLVKDEHYSSGVGVSYFIAQSPKFNHLC